MSKTSPSRQAERTERSTDALLRAAAELIAEGGMAAMTFAAIAERAGYSRGLVTARFGSKEGLVEAMIRRVWGRLRHLRVLPGIEDRPGLDSVLVLVAGIRDQAVAESVEMRALIVLMFEAVRDGGTLRQRFIRYHDGMRDDLSAALRKGVEDGSVRPDGDPEREATMIVGLLRGTSYQWLLEPDRFDPGPAYTTVIDMLGDHLARRD
jgi:AcrR family transcriptional regulator